MKSSCLCVASPNVTPFIVSVQDALMLGQSEGFNILRKHLGTTLSNDFCDVHVCSGEDQKAWLVIRDILHALLAPVVALQDHAARVAEESLRTFRQEALEYAFYGNARGAFVWLQSFLSSELSWCLSTGCPACIGSQAMDSESSLRLLVASCFLSGIESSTDLGRPTLPSFEFFIRSINEAMNDDDLWGPSFFEQVEPKAVKLQNAMQDLMFQCQTIELNMTPPESPASVISMSFLEPSVEGMPIKRSSFARKQAHMLKEEAQWLRSVVKNCWDGIDPESYAQPITTEFVRRMSAVEG
ncbi:hypothetical protein K461DRAFT_296872 [Myriangium duriaei CBS 260.36]|uniref:Uncharacterized protein n=1 Tax=Myriangium duriaei CBS 260.36 TaxID=1168546 RepID=A0A9P4MGX3_9PEZI|nr:hypothetical protein K461DRAFT_296872 [Myriangium duriaei CBS 260.36]